MRADRRPPQRRERGVRAHRHRFRVIYGDTDMMGVVYYANYLRYFEAGRNEILRELGLCYRDFEATGLSLPVSQASIKYRAPARYDDELELETRVEEVGMASVTMTYRLVRPVDGALIATGETKHACIEKGGRISRLPDEVRRKIGAE
jgi:acyl-CoA thioester hydrolase